jgi:bacillithiol system protein YtxJ
MINWINLDSEEMLDNAISSSFEQPVIFFKHSTTCSISHMAKMKLENKWDLDMPVYYLDLKAHRNISNKIAEDLHVYHESPQLILVVNGECIYDESHLDISVDEIKETIAEIGVN